VKRIVNVNKTTHRDAALQTDLNIFQFEKGFRSTQSLYKNIAQDLPDVFMIQIWSKECVFHIYTNTPIPLLRNTFPVFSFLRAVLKGLFYTYSCIQYNLILSQLWKQYSFHIFPRRTVRKKYTWVESNKYQSRPYIVKPYFPFSFLRKTVSAY
jgi:hypothetical protein